MNCNFFRYCFCVCCVAAACFLNGCRTEGCTDETALNYNSVANKDDGTCIFCRQAPVEEQVDVGFTDYNSSSTFYEQQVATVHITKSNTHFTYDECGEDTCKVFYEIENLTDKGIIFYFRINYASVYQYASIAPHETAYYTPVSFVSSSSSLCNSISPTSGFIEVTSTIDYF